MYPMKRAVASTMTALGMYGAEAAEPAPVPAAPIKMGVVTEFKRGCELLFGRCDGGRTTDAIRLGDVEAAREWVLGVTKFEEVTTGGFGRVYPITLHGRALGAVDYGLHGQQKLSGTMVSVDKVFPISSFGVASVGGFVGHIDGAIGARADLGLTVNALQHRYGVDREYEQARSSKFGGLREAAVAFIPVINKHNFVAVNQSVQAGMDKIVSGVGVGFIYTEQADDRQRLRPDGCATTAVAPRGVVVALNFCAQSIVRNTLGDKSEAKLQHYADTVNDKTAILNKVGYAPPQVTAGQLGDLVGYEDQPKRANVVQLRVSVPVGKNGEFSAFAARSTNGKSSSGFSLGYNF